MGGLWRVTAVSVGRARASNLLKFLAAGSRRHSAVSGLSEVVAPKQSSKLPQFRATKASNSSIGRSLLNSVGHDDSVTAQLFGPIHTLVRSTDDL